MPHDGRASSASVPEITVGKPAEQDGVCAAGTFPERIVGTKRIVPVNAVLRAGLARLIDAGKMIRRANGSYGTARETLITNAIATQLKYRRFAVAGFNKEIVPTEKGRRVNAEAIDTPQSRGNS